MTRVVTKVFEAWDPTFAMTVVMNAGLVVRIVRVEFTVTRHPVLPPIQRAVAFEANTVLYYADVDRFEKNTRVPTEPEFVP